MAYFTDAYMRHNDTLSFDVEYMSANWMIISLGNRFSTGPPLGNRFSTVPRFTNMV